MRCLSPSSATLSALCLVEAETADAVHLSAKTPASLDYTFEPALTAGFTSVGMNVLLTGPIPTPAVARLTDSMRADVGVMISASHNLSQDNGIKLFGPDGFKLTDEQEIEIESLIDFPILQSFLPPLKIWGAHSA